MLAVVPAHVRDMGVVPVEVSRTVRGQPARRLNDDEAAEAAAGVVDPSRVTHLGRWWRVCRPEDEELKVVAGNLNTHGEHSTALSMEMTFWNTTVQLSRLSCARSGHCSDTVTTMSATTGGDLIHGVGENKAIVGVRG